MFQAEVNSTFISQLAGKGIALKEHENLTMSIVYFIHKSYLNTEIVDGIGVSVNGDYILARQTADIDTIFTIKFHHNSKIAIAHVKMNYYQFSLMEVSKFRQKFFIKIKKLKY